LGVDAIWFLPYIPMKDLGYDTTDMRAIDLMFGTFVLKIDEQLLLWVDS
jgi:glycosidase